MFSSVLVANRGEIACRIFRTARRFGIRPLAVHSEADARAKHVREADASFLLGPSPARESYLRADRVLEAAKALGAEAIHPGYGFLSENPEFAEAVIAAGLIWIGPTPSAIRAMGLKDEAKRIAIEAGVPVLPGYQGEEQSEKRLLKEVKAIGFPVLIKAVAGGGGRGIREVKAAEEFGPQLASAKREAAAAFGDDRVLIEKLVERPRHIEVQVFGDKHGGLVHLFERDCSLQRRRQKVIEEAPAPGMTEAVRAAMTQAALKVARAVAYENAGTVEFIVDGTGPLRPDGFWFLEMNTRLQVEHPVTEAVTGLDLVEWQFRVAAGEPLPRTQDEITLTGHAIEARICAEDPAEGFRPSVGRITRFKFNKTNIRLDSGFDAGDSVSPHYDSLLAKAIISGGDRSGGITVLQMALAAAQVEGVLTNCSFLRRCLATPEFYRGALHTGLIAEKAEDLASRDKDRVLAAALLGARTAWPESFGYPEPWVVNDGFRINAQPRRAWTFETPEKERQVVELLQMEGELTRVAVNGAVQNIKITACESVYAYFFLPESPRVLGYCEFGEEGGATKVSMLGHVFTFRPAGAQFDLEDAAAGDEVKAPLPGKVVAVAAAAGARVAKGQPLVTLEAMKMEHALKAPRDGVIASVAAEAGALVKEGAVLVTLAPEEGT